MDLRLTKKPKSTLFLQTLEDSDAALLFDESYVYSK
jgi:hypothetical protein